MIEQILLEVISYWPFLLSTAFFAIIIHNKYKTGLNKYPGPVLAGFTNWWRFFDAYHNNAGLTHVALHRKHGDVVRLGPKVLSFADPRAIKIIYGLNKGFVKSDFYIVQQAVAKGVRLPSLFSSTDEDYHAKYRRCVNSAFAMSSLVSYEPLIDSTTDAFIEQTRKRYCDVARKCDFARWLQFFAFDVVGELTWSKRLGFLERDEDVDGIVEFVGDFLTYAGPVGQMPWLDLFFFKNPIRLQLQRMGLDKSVFPVTKFALAQSADRAAEMEKIRVHGVSDEESQKGADLLTKFTQAQHDHPEFMTDKQVLAACTSMIFAGSETTAVSLSSIFYHVLRHPQVYRKLMQELDEAVQRGDIEDRPNQRVSWAESQKLPYLDAVIQEGFRMHPAAGALLERIVPPQGMDILGEHVPGGTIVGCNAWVLHRRPEVFGDDVDQFRPERWLEADAERLKIMKATMFQFSAGARTCIGKNISLLEIYKLVPTFLRNFEIKLERNEEWKTANTWFVKPVDFYVHFGLRNV